MTNEELKEAYERLKWLQALFRGDPPPGMQEAEKERLMMEYVTLTETLNEEVRTRRPELLKPKTPQAEGAGVFFDLAGAISQLIRQ